jgi:uncharacterized protein YndB with AHSA1/START domain
MTVAAGDCLRISRRFEATPRRLFDAWTDPDLVATWLFTTPESESHHTALDVRVGGQWEIVDRRGGVDYRAIGEYRVVEPPHRLVFSFGMPQFASGFTTVTVEIAADGDGAVMTLTQEGLPPEHIPPTRDGWSAMFDLLAGRLTAADRGPRPTPPL